MHSRCATAKADAGLRGGPGEALLNSGCLHLVGGSERPRVPGMRALQQFRSGRSRTAFTLSVGAAVYVTAAGYAGAAGGPA